MGSVLEGFSRPPFDLAALRSGRTEIFCAQEERGAQACGGMLAVCEFVAVVLRLRCATLRTNGDVFALRVNGDVFARGLIGAVLALGTSGIIPFFEWRPWIDLRLGWRLRWWRRCKRREARFDRIILAHFIAMLCSRRGGAGLSLSF